MGFLVELRQASKENLRFCLFVLRPVAVGASIPDHPFLCFAFSQSGSKATFVHSRYLACLPMEIKTKYMAVNSEKILRKRLADLATSSNSTLSHLQAETVPSALPAY